MHTRTCLNFPRTTLIIWLRVSGGQPPHCGQPALIHWVAQRCAARWASGRLLGASHLWAYCFISWPSSVPTDFLLHWFWLPTANLMPPLCLLQRHRVIYQPSTTGWIVEAGLLFAEPDHVHQRPSPQIAIWHWANIANGHQCQHWFANIGPMLASQRMTWNGWQMVGKLLASQCCITNLMPTLGQCWKSDHELTFSQKCWGMVGKGLVSQHRTGNLMPMLDQHWNSDHLLLFPKIGWQMVGNWSDSQCI